MVLRIRTGVRFDGLPMSGFTGPRSSGNGCRRSFSTSPMSATSFGSVRTRSRGGKSCMDGSPNAGSSGAVRTHNASRADVATRRSLSRVCEPIGFLPGHPATSGVPIAYGREKLNRIIEMAGMRRDIRAPDVLTSEEAIPPRPLCRLLWSASPAREAI